MTWAGTDDADSALRLGGVAAIDRFPDKYGISRSSTCGNSSHGTSSNRDCNYRHRAFGLWWLSQFRRWGTIKEPPDYQSVVKRVLRPDIYLEAMKEINVTPKIADLQRITFGDGTTFDASDPEKHATSFAIHSRVVT